MRVWTIRTGYTTPICREGVGGDRMCALRVDSKLVVISLGYNAMYCTNTVCDDGAETD